MSLNRDGFCSGCHNWALDYEGMECPWCHAASADKAMKDLHLDPDASPVEVIIAVRAALEALRAQQRQLFTLRSRAARGLLRRGNVAEDVKAARTKLPAVERWAVADQPAATRDRLAPRQMKTKRGLRIDYEERMARRAELMEITAQDQVPERLRPALGSRSPD